MYLEHDFDENYVAEPHLEYQSFEELRIWKAAMKLVNQVYPLIKDTREFALRDQAMRSLISVPSNIAEGYERESNKEVIRFVNIAKASCGELRTQLLIFKMIEKTDKFNLVIANSRILSKMISKFIVARKQFK